MSTNAAASPTLNAMTQLKAGLKTTWMTGNYDVFSRYMEPDAQIFYRRIGVERGQQFLDVGCGAGQLALIAARARARATGCDISTNWLERARERATLERLNVRFEEGDAEALPYKDGQFDVVASLIGAMFAPQPDLAAAEMLRVCRPGGTIAMANWTPDGFIGAMFRTVGRRVPPPAGLRAPVEWGSEARLRELFGDRIRIVPRTFVFRFASPAAFADYFKTYYGPTVKAFEALGDDGKALHDDLVELAERHNVATDGTAKLPAAYVRVLVDR